MNTETTKKDGFTRNPINFSNIKIDSLKLTFPRNSVQIIDGKFTKKYHKIYIESGEVDEEHIDLDKHKVEKIKGISSRIALGQWVMGNNINEVLFVQINAKMCRETYFEGITWQNWRKVYNHIIAQQVIYLDERTFLTGMVTDIDFAYDFLATPQELSDLITLTYGRVKPTLHKYVSTPFKQKANVGIQFNKREKATPSKPFAKIYHKGLELSFKSHEFADSFLRGVDYENVARLEVTLKNSRDKKYHVLNRLKDMKDLLDLKKEEKEKIVFSAMPKYLDSIKAKVMQTELKPQDAYMVWLMDILTKHGYGKAAFFQGLDIFDDKQKRHRMKVRLEKLLNDIPDQNLLDKNRRIDDLLKQLKII